MSLARKLFVAAAGAASLVLEVALNRLCGLYLGESMLAATLTLSVYLLGLSSFPLVMQLGRRGCTGAPAGWQDQSGSPAPRRILQMMLAACGLLCLMLGSFSLVPAPLVVTALAGESTSTGAGLLMSACALVLFLAGYLSGAVLPLLSSIRPAESLSACAAFNFGACGGGLLSGLVLLPSLGISNSFLSCAGLYLALCLLAWLAVPPDTSLQNQEPREPETLTEHPPLKGKAVAVPIFLLIFSCLTLFWETAVLRLTAQLAGSAVQALAMTAAIFIAGLSLGNWLGLRTKLAPATAGLTALLALALHLSGLATSADCYSNLRDFYYQLRSQFAAVEPEGAALMFLSLYLALPLAVTCGLILPSCYLMAGKKERSSALTFSLFYGLGSLAAALAPFLFCLAMKSGFSLAGGGTLESSLRLSLIVGVLAVAYLYLVLPEKPHFLKPWLMGPALLALIFLVFNKPGISAQYLSSGRGNLPVSISAARAILAQEEKWLTPIYFQDGFFSSVALTACQPLNLMTLRLNGNVEATMALDESRVSPAEPTHRMLAVLPCLLQEKPDSALIIGLGLGTTSDTAARLIPPPAVTTAEIEPQVQQALKAAYLYLKRPAPNLGEIVIADGRTYLGLKDKTYSLITVQPSEPWVAGAGALFTREFLQLTRKRLKDDGVFSQWLQLYGMRREALVAYLKTFQLVYPNFLIFHDHGKNAGEIILLGLKGDGKQALNILDERLAAHEKPATALGRLMTGADISPQAIKDSLFRLESPQGREDSPICSDDNQFMQYHSRLQDSKQALLADSENRKYLKEHTNNVLAEKKLLLK
ncbi:MAG: hypothetical protein HY986_13060 [Candidatus Melainabacteria bacterium]|nr:hypothetical protein [Candidatus Melainabacteria bacterium]